MPGGKHENMKTWSKEEDYIIIDGVKLHGHQWRIIVRNLPGRSVSSTRNRFNRIEQGRMMRETGTRGRNMCHFCWQPKKGHICTAKDGGGPHVVTQALVVVRPAPLPFVLAQHGAVPRVAGTSDANPAPWARPNVQKSSSSSMLSVLGGEDLSAIFGEWAKADAADNAGGIGLCSAASAYAAEVSARAALPPLPPPLRSTAPPLPNEQQLEAIAPPALLRMASGEGPTRWAPPKLTRSLSSFFKTLPQDLLQGHLAAVNDGDAPSDASQSSDMSSVR